MPLGNYFREESEINTIKKACQVTLDIYSKYLKEQIMDIIDNDKVGHQIRMYMLYQYYNLRLNIHEFSIVNKSPVNYN